MKKFVIKTRLLNDGQILVVGIDGPKRDDVRTFDSQNRAFVEGLRIFVNYIGEFDVISVGDIFSQTSLSDLFSSMSNVTHMMKIEERELGGKSPVIGREESRTF